MKILMWLAAAAVLIQFVPFGHDHTNPAVSGEPGWDSPQTKDLIHRACYDCHSNQTVWPWYSHVAPVSWLVQRDVNGGRRHLNFTEWATGAPQRHAKDIAAEVKQGDMPPWFYLPMHPAARLSDDEKQLLIKGVEGTFGPQTPARKKLKILLYGEKKGGDGGEDAGLRKNVASYTEGLKCRRLCPQPQLINLPGP